MRRIEKQLRVLWLVLCLSTHALAALPDPALYSDFRVTQADLPGYELVHESSFYAPMLSDALPDSQRYAYFMDDWRADGVSVQCIYAVCPNRQMTRIAQTEICGRVNTGVDPVDPPPMAVDAYGEVHPNSFQFAMDRVIVFISVSDHDDDGSHAGLADRLLRTVHQRLWDAGARPAPPMVIEEETILSGGVSFATGETFAVRYRTSTDPGFTPIGFVQFVFPPSDEFPILRGAGYLPDGQGVLGWDGTDRAGNRVPDGDYLVKIRIFDSLGRAITRDHLVPVRSQPPTPVSLQLNVLSKHVKPHKNEQARVQATATNPPTTLSYSIYRGGQGEPPQGPPVLTAQGLPAPNGALELVWDGTDASGQRVANGSYVMVVTARDNTGHEASSSAYLVVNFQGGAQGARSLWQFASPAQRWLSPSDALRLAFPIPCLGAELAGNYLFSPEQLSSTGNGLSN